MESKYQVFPGDWLEAWKIDRADGLAAVAIIGSHDSLGDYSTSVEVRDGKLLGLALGDPEAFVFTVGEDVETPTGFSDLPAGDDMAEIAGYLIGLGLLPPPI